MIEDFNSLNVELNKSKEKIREIERNYKLIFDSTGTANAIFDTNCVLILQNKLSKDYLGAGENGGIGLSVLEIFGKKKGKNVFDRMKRVISTGISEVFETEFSLLSQNKCFKSTYLPVFDENKKVVSVQVISQDITDFKKNECDIINAKEKAEEYANLLKNITDNIPAYIAVVDINTLKYKFVSLNFTSSFNKTMNEIIGAHISEVIGEENTKFAMKHINEVRQGRPSSYINSFKLAEGERYINVNYVPGYNEKAELKDIIVLSYDISKIKETEIELRKAKEKAEESDNLKTAFLQNISHEIRTPMNAIVGFSDLLDEPDLLFDDKKKYVSIIKKSTDQLLSIISDIITISSLETKQEKLKIQKVCINNLISDLISSFKLQIKNKNISIHSNFQLNNNESEIYTDNIKVTQILSNLITNALKFTNQGNIEIGYYLKPQTFDIVDTEQQIELEFYVKDTGIGIKSEMLEKIFERFSQANDNINKKYGGTGLGLTISKAFTELLGGRIWVESEIDKGSVFYFSIPYNPVSEIEKTEI